MPSPDTADRELMTAAAYALKSGDDLANARRLAKAGALTADGKQKFEGGPSPKKGEKRQVFEPTTEEIAAFNKRDRLARYVLLAKDEFGYFIMGSGRRSKSYPTIGRIPIMVIRDFAG